MNEENTVDCLNWKLDEVKTIGQDKDENKPFYFKDVEQMNIRNKKFYLRKEETIEIVDEKDGNVLKTIDIESYKFIIDDKKEHLVVFCYDSIERYQLENGDLISQTDIKSSIPNEFKFHDYKDEKYLLSSKNKEDLYSINI
jgi:hypothetical protein